VTDLILSLIEKDRLEELSYASLLTGIDRRVIMEDLVRRGNIELAAEFFLSYRGKSGSLPAELGYTLIESEYALPVLQRISKFQGIDQGRAILRVLEKYPGKLKSWCNRIHDEKGYDIKKPFLEKFTDLSYEVAEKLLENGVLNSRVGCALSSFKASDQERIKTLVTEYRGNHYSFHN
jgi:hypothetical protein